MPAERKHHSPLLNWFTLLMAGCSAAVYAAGGHSLYERVTFDDSVNNRSNNLSQAARSLETVPTNSNQSQLIIEDSANIIGDEGAIDDTLRQIAEVIREK